MKLIFVLGVHNGLVIDSDTREPSLVYKPSVTEEVTQLYRLVHWNTKEAWYIPQQMRTGYAVKLLAERAAS